MPVLNSRFGRAIGEKLEADDYAYRVRETETKAGRCPKCNGFLSKDPITYCVNCSWEGETREAEEIGEGCGDRTQNTARYWNIETTGGKRTRTGPTLEKAARVYEMRELGINTKVIQKVVGVRRERVSELYYIHKREVLGQ